MDAICPQCQRTLLWQRDNLFYCSHCNQTWRQIAHCPDCHHPLEKMQACGAVDYFCQHGHGLVSKKRITLHYERQA